MTYFDRLTETLIEIYFSRDKGEKIDTPTYNTAKSRLKDIAKYIISCHAFPTPIEDSQLSNLYGSLKDKHCHLKLEHSDLKMEYSLLKIKRKVAYERAALYYQRYWEMAKSLEKTP